LSNLTVSGNSASNIGGGIDILTSVVTIANITVANNTAVELGGGLYMSLDANVTLANSIVANSSQADCSDPEGIQVNVNNWFSDISCDGIAQGDPKLGPLTNNGGASFTHALLDGSGAIDTGDNQFCTDAPVSGKDQRGQPRPGDTNANCDIGAFEKQSTSIVIPPTEPPTTEPPVIPPTNPTDLAIATGSANFSHQLKTVDFPDPSIFGVKPLVIVGPPTTRGLQPGNVRINQVTQDGFRIQMKEYDYLFARGEGAHAIESADYLAIEPGIYTLDDGTIIEAGSFTINGTGQWLTQQLSANFPDKPTIIATLQTTNGASSVMIRLNKVTSSSFEAALYEEEKLQNSGHLGEKAAFIAIYHPDAIGAISANDADTTFALSTLQLNLGSQLVEGTATKIRLEEEQSADVETKHFGTENVDVLVVGDGVFAQITTKTGNDTTDLRKRSSN
jgi:hypothetical protein